MKLKLFLIIASFLCLNSFLQAQNKQSGYWQKIASPDGKSGISSMVTDVAGNLYVAGQFTDSMGYYYVAKWDGAQWSEIGTGSNALHANNVIASVAIDFKENLYAIGPFTDSMGYSYLAKWDGSSWNAIGKKFTDSLQSNFVFSYGNVVTVDDSGYVYVSGVTLNGLDGDNVAVLKWNNKKWTLYSSTSGSNYSGYGYGANALAVDKSNNIYAGGQFMDSYNYVYVGEWNRYGWGEMYNMNAHGGPIYTISTAHAGDVYVAGNLDYIYDYTTGSFGTTWYPLIGKSGSVTTHEIFSIIADRKGKVYIGGDIPTSNNYLSVATWNTKDTTWDELGTGYNALKAPYVIKGSFNFIHCLAVDTAGHVYAANISDSLGKFYIAKYIPCAGFVVPTVIATDTSICRGSSTTLSIGNDTLKNITHWVWYVHRNDTIPIDSGMSINVSPAVNTMYYVKADGGCVASGFTDSIMVNVSFPNVSISAVPDSICSGSISTISVSGDSTYQWKPSPTLTLINGYKAKASPVSTTTYTLFATDILGCMASDSIVVYVLPKPYAHYITYPDTTQPHHWFVLNQCTGTPPLSYTWHWGDSSTVSTGANPSHTYTHSAYFDICVTVTDSFGCSESYCDSSTYIMRTDGSPITVTVVSTPTGINNISLPNTSYAKLYPNPSKGLFTVESSGLGDVQAQIYNILAEPVLSVRLKNNAKTTINMAGYPAGIYMLKVNNGSAVLTKNIVIVE